MGLVNHVYALEELPDKAFELAAKIVSKGQIAVRNSVEAVVKTAELPQKEGQAYEASLFGLTCSTEDFKEGTSAFLEKRKPDFKLR